MESLHGFVSDDGLTYAPLRKLGWHVEAVPWRRPAVDWGVYEAVIIRSTWDYQHAPQAFLSVLEHIQRSGAYLENALDLVQMPWTSEWTGGLSKGQPRGPARFAATAENYK
jgi:hypothetical protein